MTPAERGSRLMDGRDASMLDALAAAYAEVGRFAEAVDAGNRAVRLAVQEGKGELSAAIEARVGLYEGKAAFRK